MKVELDLYTQEGFEWPRCYYDQNLRCGDRETDGLAGNPRDAEEPRASGQIAALCECPSCPLRCAIRDALAKLVPTTCGNIKSQWRCQKVVGHDGQHFWASEEYQVYW